MRPSIFNAFDSLIIGLPFLINREYLKLWFQDLVIVKLIKQFVLAQKTMQLTLTFKSHLLFVFVAVATLFDHFTCGPVLNNFPILFEMTGPTTYNPDSGSSSLNGYNLKVGFMGYSWLGIEFPSSTSSDKSDVLILTCSDFYSTMNNQFEGHQILVADYYWNSSTGLHLDSNTQSDISSFNYASTKQYELEMIRFLGSNSGEDWDASGKRYSVQQVCFYTSNILFDVETWKQGLSQCYSYQIDNFNSRFVGKSLKSFTINGYTARVYGWIDGPYLTDNVYIFQETPLFTYTREPAFILELGTTEGNHGQDYYVDSPTASESGDYYGDAVATMTKDSLGSGFQNNGLSAEFWNAVPASQIAEYGYTALRVMFSRNISTFDSYDKDLQSTFIFCLHIYAQGSITSDLSDKTCEIVELSYSFPRQEYGTNFGEKAATLTTLGVLMLILIAAV